MEPFSPKVGVPFPVSLPWVPAVPISFSCMAMSHRKRTATLENLVPIFGLSLRMDGGPQPHLMPPFLGHTPSSATATPLPAAMGPVCTPALRYDIVRRFSALSNSLGSPCAKGKCQCGQRMGLGISVPHSFMGASNRKHRHRPVCALGIYLLFPPSRTQGTNRLGVAAGQLSSLLQLRKFSPSLEGLGKRNQLGAPVGLIPLFI